MTRNVTCSLCDGAKVDADGNRCIECAGIGFFPHWNQRMIGIIEQELADSVRILNQEPTATRKPAKGQTQESVDQARSDSIRYWSARVEQLKGELDLARKYAGKDENGNV